VRISPRAGSGLAWCVRASAERLAVGEPSRRAIYQKIVRSRSAGFAAPPGGCRKCACWILVRARGNAGGPAVVAVVGRISAGVTVPTTRRVHQPRLAHQRGKRARVHALWPLRKRSSAASPRIEAVAAHRHQPMTAHAFVPVDHAPRKALAPSRLRFPCAGSAGRATTEYWFSRNWSRGQPGWRRAQAQPLGRAAAVFIASSRSRPS